MPVLDKANERDVKRYEEFIRNSPYRALTQDPNWADVKDDWGNEQVYVERDGEIVAAMSLLIRKVPGGFSLLYAPRGPVCDFHDEALVAELLREAEAVAKKHKAFALKMDPEILYSEELNKKYSDAGYVVRNVDADKDELIQPRLNMIVKLEGEDEESIMMRYKKKTRNIIRGAIKKGWKCLIPTAMNI